MVSTKWDGCGLNPLTTATFKEVIGGENLTALPPRPSLIQARLSTAPLAVLLLVEFITTATFIMLTHEQCKSEKKSLVART
jgi:hypothetical protein